MGSFGPEGVFLFPWDIPVPLGLSMKVCRVCWGWRKMRVAFAVREGDHGKVPTFLP